MTLYLLPNVLGAVEHHQLYLPASVDHAMERIDGLIAESEGEGRRYLKRFITKKRAHEMPIALISKGRCDVDFLLEPLCKGEEWGLVSDCGLPCIADPGASLVSRAYSLNLSVQALSGPCSLTHALMLSGLNAQKFLFHGYLSKEPSKRAMFLRQVSYDMRGMTHLFIEAPYRALYSYLACIECLPSDALLCVAASLTLPHQWVKTLSISEWKKGDQASLHPHLNKQAVLFLFFCPLRNS